MSDIHVKPSGEAELVGMFKTLFEPSEPPPDLLIGIGDDAAVFEPGVDPETRFVMTTDMLMEGVHFRRDWHSLHDIGWRTAIANISDVAAMGAVPRWGVACLAVPTGMTTVEILEFAGGLKDAMDEHDALIVGGDLTRSMGGIAVSMTLIGETTGRILTRSGARLGDLIAVTGRPGAAAAGLAALSQPDACIPDHIRTSVIKSHRRPHARILSGQVFANKDGINAMMDLSDGLGIDLYRLCEASGVGCRIFENKFPYSDEIKSVAEALGRDPLEFFTSGEDFELLVVGDGPAIEYVGNFLLQEYGGPEVTVIGEIIDRPFGRHLARIDGTVLNPSELGWDHFREGR